MSNCGIFLLTPQFVKYRVWKEASCQRVPQTVYAKEILRLGRKSSLARVPTPAAAAPAAPEVGSDARPGSSFRRPGALPPYSSLRALAEVLLPCGAPRGVQLGDCWGASGPLGSVRAASTAGHRRGAELPNGGEGARRTSGVRALLDLRDSEAVDSSLEGQQTCSPSGAKVAPWSLACHCGRGRTRGRGCCSRGVFAPALIGTPPTLWALYLLPPPHWVKSVGRGRKTLASCPGPPGRGQWITQVCFWARGGEGQKRLWSFSAAKLLLGRVGARREGRRRAGGRTAWASRGQAEAGCGERPPCGSVCVNMCFPAACGRAWLGLARSLLRTLDSLAAGLPLRRGCPSPRARTWTNQEEESSHPPHPARATRCPGQETQVREEVSFADRLPPSGSRSRSGFPGRFPIPSLHRSPSAWTHPEIRAGGAAHPVGPGASSRWSQRGPWNEVRAPAGPEPPGEAGWGPLPPVEPQPLRPSVCPSWPPCQVRPRGLSLRHWARPTSLPNIPLGSCDQPQGLKQICSWPLSCLVYTSLPDAPRKGLA